MSEQHDDWPTFRSMAGLTPGPATLELHRQGFTHKRIAEILKIPNWVERQSHRKAREQRDHPDKYEPDSPSYFYHHERFPLQQEHIFKSRWDTSRRNRNTLRPLSDPETKTS